MKPVKFVEKPWGSELWVAVGEHYALKIIRFKQGSRSSLQYHNLKTEHIYVQEGVLQAEEEVDGALVSRQYGPGEVIFNPPGKKHRVSAVTDVVLIEVSTPELDDVIRVEDDFGRST